MQTPEDQPIFSVIIPVHNREKFIERAVRSVLNQTIASFEVLCINNGSTDTTWDILTRLNQKDERVKIFDQNDRGRCAARNRGLDEAQGTWICFLDSDDFYHPDHLKGFADQSAKHPDHKAFASTLIHHHALAAKNSVNQKDDVELNIKHFVTDNPISLIQLCIHSSIAENLRFAVPDLPIAEDWLFVRELLLQTNPWKFHHPSVEVGEHEQRSMNTFDLDRIATCNMQSSELFAQRNQLPASLKSSILANGYLLAAHIYLQAGSFAKAKMMLSKAGRFPIMFSRSSFYRAAVKMIVLPVLSLSRMSPNKKV